jgi:hypothetical protein
MTLMLSERVSVSDGDKTQGKNEKREQHKPDGRRSRQGFSHFELREMRGAARREAVRP